MGLKKRCNFRLGTYGVSLGVATILFTVVLISIFMCLGFWQYQRGVAQSTRLQLSQEVVAPISYKQQNVRYQQHLRLVGHYLPHSQFLLDNKFYQHRFGYHVLSPFVLSSGEVVLVNRGFIAGNRQRSQLPKPSFVPGEHIVTGRVDKIQSNRFISKQIIDNPNRFPVVIEQVDFAIIAAIIQRKLLPWVLRLDPDQANGYIRDWQVVNMSPARHFAYAVQWLLIAGGFLIAIIAANTRKISCQHNTLVSQNDDHY
jgi:surfeit locus 1 family protein